MTVVFVEEQPLGLPGSANKNWCCVGCVANFDNLIYTSNGLSHLPDMLSVQVIIIFIKYFFPKALAKK